jgi:cell division cycle 20-like protein 1 (cofactor of APC complex)
LDIFQGILTPSPGFLSQSSQQRLPYTNSNSNLLRTRDPNTIFRYSARHNTHDLHYSPYSLSPISPASIRLLRSPRKQLRKIPKTPFKVLDAPELQDDFYLNLVDWSSTNILAVGLNASVYLWNANTSNVTRLCDLQTESDTVTSVAWSDRGQYVAVGTHKGNQTFVRRSQRKRKEFFKFRHCTNLGCSNKS